MADLSTAYGKLLDYERRTMLYQSCRAILGWDQETYMPPGGAELRAEQVSLLSGILHRRRAATEFGDLLAAAERENSDAAPDSDAGANLRELRRDYEYAVRLPPDLIEERARLSVLARRAWVQARANAAFGEFRDWLAKVVAISRQQADALGYEEHPLDALLDYYEPEETVATLEPLFAELRERLAGLLRRITESGRTIDAGFVCGTSPVEAQREFAHLALRSIGFDLQRGRLDETVHPFCSGVGPGDVRLTTRYGDGFFRDGLFSVLHEAGHGIYEQGLAPEQFGTPLGRSCSTGVHESQSRMWENFVGRSRGFWRHLYPKAQEMFPEMLGGVPLERFWRAIHEVAPSFVRVDADEVTYNLHILLRFQLERRLLGGGLDPADLPEAWNAEFERLFGLVPPSDREGCLQDVHWSAVLFGYFPTYTLGNLYAAQLFEQARSDLGDLEEQFAGGAFAPLRGWLRERIHVQGRRHPPRALIETVTGSPPSPEPLLRYLESTYEEAYGL